MSPQPSPALTPVTFLTLNSQVKQCDGGCREPSWWSQPCPLPGLGVRGGPGDRQEGHGAGEAWHGRDSAPGAVATGAAALSKEPVGAKYTLTALGLLTEPTGSRDTAWWPPETPATTTGLRAAASTAMGSPGCSTSTPGPLPWLVPRDSVLGTPETWLPGPKSPSRQQRWGRARPAGAAPLFPPQKAN